MKTNTEIIQALTFRRSQLMQVINLMVENGLDKTCAMTFEEEGIRLDEVESLLAFAKKPTEPTKLKKLSVRNSFAVFLAEFKAKANKLRSNTNSPIGKKIVITQNSVRVEMTPEELLDQEFKE